MDAIFDSIIIYARDMKVTADFYRRYFGFATTGQIIEGLIELKSPNGGLAIRIHQAAKSVKLGQVGVKICFSVRNVEIFKAESESRGLRFGSTHVVDGYSFANAKDPDRNSVSISSRTYRDSAMAMQA